MSISDDTLKSQADIDVNGEDSPRILFDHNDGVGSGSDSFMNGADQSISFTDQRLYVIQSNDQANDDIEIDFDQLTKELEAFGEEPTFVVEQDEESTQFDYLFVESVTNTLVEGSPAIPLTSSCHISPNQHNESYGDIEGSTQSSSMFTSFHNSNDNVVGAAAYPSALLFPPHDVEMHSTKFSASSANTDIGSPFSTGTTLATTCPSPVSQTIDCPADEITITSEAPLSVDAVTSQLRTSFVDLTREEVNLPGVTNSLESGTIHVGGRYKSSEKKKGRTIASKEIGEPVINCLIREVRQCGEATEDNGAERPSILENPTDIFPVPPSDQEEDSRVLREYSSRLAASAKIVFEEAYRLRQKNTDLQASVHLLQESNLTLLQIRDSDQDKSLRLMSQKLCTKIEESSVLKYQHDALTKFQYLSLSDKQKTLIGAWSNKMMEYSTKIGEQGFEIRVKDNEIQKLSKELKEKTMLANDRTETIVNQADQLTRGTSELEQWKTRYALLKAHLFRADKNQVTLSNVGCQDLGQINYEQILVNALRDNRKLTQELVKVKKENEAFKSIFKKATSVAAANKKKMESSTKMVQHHQTVPQRRPNLSLHLNASTPETISSPLESSPAHATELFKSSSEQSLKRMLIESSISCATKRWKSSNTEAC